MLSYVLRRLATSIPTLFLVVTIAFFLVRVAPGGPFDREKPIPPEIKRNMEKSFGLDQPLIVQYGMYLKNLAQGDLGPSYIMPQFTVRDLFAAGLPVSIWLGASALVLALLLGGALGIVAALCQNKPPDYAVIATATAGSTIPNFVDRPADPAGVRAVAEVAAGRRLAGRRLRQHRRADHHAGIADNSPWSPG